MPTRFENYSSFFLRLAIGFSFLSAVTDRFGFWGSYGQPNIAWGDFSHFVAYTAKLNWFLPGAAILPLAWAATLAEAALGIALVLGIFTRASAILGGLLLVLFSIAMTLALGIKAPLNYSVFTAAAASFLLASCNGYFWSLDSLRQRARTAKQPLAT